MCERELLCSGQFFLPATAHPSTPVKHATYDEPLRLPPGLQVRRRSRGHPPRDFHVSKGKKGPSISREELSIVGLIQTPPELSKVSRKKTMGASCSGSCPEKKLHFAAPKAIPSSILQKFRHQRKWNEYIVERFHNHGNSVDVGSLGPDVPMRCPSHDLRVTGWILVRRRVYRDTNAQEVLHVPRRLGSA